MVHNPPSRGLGHIEQQRHPPQLQMARWCTATSSTRSSNDKPHRRPAPVCSAPRRRTMPTSLPNCRTNNPVNDESTPTGQPRSPAPAGDPLPPQSRDYETTFSASSFKPASPIPRLKDHYLRFSALEPAGRPLSFGEAPELMKSIRTLRESITLHADHEFTSKQDRHCWLRAARITTFALIRAVR